MGQHDIKRHDHQFLQHTKLCIRIMEGIASRTPVDPYFKANKVLKFEDLVQIKLVKSRYRTTYKLLPPPIVNIVNDNEGKKEQRWYQYWKCTK